MHPAYREVVMLRKVITLFVVAAAMTLSTPAWSYDEVAARGFAEMFATAQGAKVGKDIHLLGPDMFVEKIRRNEPLLVLDIRTPAETAIVGVTMENSMRIPLHELFSRENLAKLPTDRPVIVVCQSGVRGTAAGTALRFIGFKNAYILKGGLAGVVKYLGPKEAYAPLKEKEVKK